jgi:hypothetical protein
MASDAMMNGARAYPEFLGYRSSEKDLKPHDRLRLADICPAIFRHHSMA